MAENVEMIRPINLPEAQQLSENDVFILDSETGGVRKIPKNKVYTPVDDTLSESGEAADAKVTGEKIDELKAETALIQNPTKTLSGALCSFTDGADMPMVACTASIEPQQSGTGTPSPENVRPISGRESVNVKKTGKNLLKVDSVNTVGRGITQTLNEDGTITLSGTSTSNYNGQGVNGSTYTKLPAGTYRFVDVGETSGATFYYYLRVQGNPAWIQSGQTFTVSEGSGCWIVLYFLASTAVSGTHGLMIVSENSTYNTYEPYNGTTTTTPLGRTVYGGTLDVVSGVLTVDRVGVDMGTLSWENYKSGGFRATLAGAIGSTGAIDDPALVTSMYRTYGYNATLGNGMASIAGGSLWCVNSDYTTDATAFKNGMSGQTAVYRLQNPTTYQLTPTEVNTLLGENNVWADSGDVEVTYRKDINIVIDELTNAIVSLGSNV